MANTKVKLGFYKLHEQAVLPKFATEGSACFDLSYSPAPNQTSIAGFNSTNSPITRTLGPNQSVDIMPKERLLIPSGFIMDIPEGYSVRIHPRSGLAIKQGLTMINCEGVIDHDYVEETKIVIFNTSDNKITIEKGTRMCQGELVRMLSYDIADIEEAPTQKTSRNGGMGSTGLQ